MEKINVGVIGTGLAWEKLHYPAYQELPDRYEVKALCDIDRGQAEVWAERLGLDPKRDVYTDFQAMLERQDIQAIDIMVPIAKNHPVADG
jgi:predicted dehydrogenase